jgi:hypothetical protein
MPTRTDLLSALTHAITRIALPLQERIRVELLQMQEEGDPAAAPALAHLDHEIFIASVREERPRGPH